MYGLSRWQRFKFVMASVFTWLRYFGPIVLGVLAVVAVVGLGAYALATANPVVKLSITLGGVLFYNFTGLIWKHLPVAVTEKKGVRSGMGCLLALVMFVAIYTMFLSALLTSWPISASIFIGLIFAIMLVVLDEKKLKIPASVIWVRNGIFIFQDLRI